MMFPSERCINRTNHRHHDRHHRRCHHCCPHNHSNHHHNSHHHHRRQCHRCHHRHHHHHHHRRRHYRQHRHHHYRRRCCVRAPVAGSATYAGRNVGFVVRVGRGSTARPLSRPSPSTGSTAIWRTSTADKMRSVHFLLLVSQLYITDN